MTTPRRPLLVLAALGLVLFAAVGCGVKEKDGAQASDPASVPSVTTPATGADDETTTTEGSEEETTTTERSEDETTTTEGSGSDDYGVPSIPQDQKDQIIKIYTDLGLSEEQAECLVDALFDQVGSNSFDPSDTAAIFDFLDQCDISLSDLSGSFGGNGN